MDEIRVTHPNNRGSLWIRNTRYMNLTFMVKLGWRIMKERDSQWLRVHVSKYMKEEWTLQRMQFKIGASNSWKGITEGVNVLKKDGAKFLETDVERVFGLILSS